MLVPFAASETGNLITATAQQTTEQRQAGRCSAEWQAGSFKNQSQTKKSTLKVSSWKEANICGPFFQQKANHWSELCTICYSNTVPKEILFLASVFNSEDPVSISGNGIYTVHSCIVLRKSSHVTQNADLWPRNLCMQLLIVFVIEHFTQLYNKQKQRKQC